MIFINFIFFLKKRSSDNCSTLRTKISEKVKLENDNSSLSRRQPNRALDLPIQQGSPNPKKSNANSFDQMPEILSTSSKGGLSIQRDSFDQGTRARRKYKHSRKPKISDADLHFFCRISTMLRSVLIELLWRNSKCRTRWRVMNPSR